MKKLILFCTLLLALSGAKVFAGNTGDGSRVVIVKLREDSNSAAQKIRMNPAMPKSLRATAMREARNSTQNAFIQSVEKPSTKLKVLDRLWLSNMIVCEADDETIALLSSNPAVEYVADNSVCQVEFTPEGMPATAYGTSEDPVVADHLKMVHAIEANAYGYDGEGVVVAIIDSGVNYTHEDISGSLWQSDKYPNHGWDFSDNDDDPTDATGHGSHCAGIIAGNGANGNRTGVAPGARLMILKVTDSEGYSEISDAIKAIEFAVENGANLISMSMGWQNITGDEKKVWRDAMTELLEYDVLAVVAAGNEGGNQVYFPVPYNVRTPGSCPPAWHAENQSTEENPATSSVVTIGSLDEDGVTVSGFSSLGPVTWQDVPTYTDFPYSEGGLIKPDIAAPGNNILSLEGTSGYTLKSGTSMATPCVAGIVAAMLSKNNSLTPAEIVRILSQSSKKIHDGGINNYSGAGRADAINATFYTPNIGVNCVSMTMKEEGEGFANGMINAGETLKVSLDIENTSDEDLSGYTIEVTSGNDKVKVTDLDTNPAQTIKAGETTTLADLFRLETDKSAGFGETAEIYIVIRQGEKVFTNMFLPVVHKAILSSQPYTFTETDGNGNGIFERQETAEFRLDIVNEGNEPCENVTAHLTLDSPYMELVEDITSAPATIDKGISYSFKAKAGELVPDNHTARMSLSLKGSNIDTTFHYSVNIGKTGILLIDKSRLEGETSAQVIASKLKDMGISYDITEEMPADISPYNSVWLCAGVYPTNTSMTKEEAEQLADYIAAGGKVYAEGGDLWYAKKVSLREIFHVNIIEDHGGDLTDITGCMENFNERQFFKYTFEAKYIDNIEPADEYGTPMYMNADPEYVVTIGRKGGAEGGGTTIASSVEMGAVLSESTEMLQSCLDFLGLGYTPLADVSGAEGEAELHTATDNYLCGQEQLRIKARIVACSDTPLTNVKAYCTANGSTQQKTLQGFSLRKGESFEFYFDQPVAVKAGDNVDYTIKAEAAGKEFGSVEGTVTVYAFRPQHMIVVEEGTGMDYAQAPMGTTAMRWLGQKYPDNYIGISVHHADALAEDAYTQALGFDTWPSVLVNRTEKPEQILVQAEDAKGKFFSMQGGAEDTFLKELAALPAVNVAVEATIEGGKADIKATVTPAADIDNAAYNVAFALVEEGVTNAAYYQENAYAGSDAEIGGYEDRPARIEGSAVTFTHVARGIWPDAKGMEGALPASLACGNDYTVDYEVTLPATIAKANNVDVVAMLIDSRTGHIVNAGRWNNPDKSSISEAQSVRREISFYRLGNYGVARLDGTMEGRIRLTLTALDGKTVAATETTVENNEARIYVGDAEGVFILTIETDDCVKAVKVLL